MRMKLFAAAACGAAALSVAAPALAGPATMTFQITVTGVDGSAVMPATTTFTETFTLQPGVFSASGPSTELMGDLSGADGLTADLKSLVDLSGASDFSNWSLGTFSPPVSPPFTLTEGDLFENLFALGSGAYQQSIDGGSLPHYSPTSQSAAGLKDFFLTVQPMPWYERVYGPSFNLLAGYNGTAVLTGFSSGAPEPAAWALMLLGFGTAGAALRRRRSPAAA